MKQSEVKVGETYLMNHTSGRIQVKITEQVTRRGFGANGKDRIHWLGLNLKTGRTIEIKSAVKLS